VDDGRLAQTTYARIAIEHVGDAVIVTDGDERILRVNGAAERLYGLSAREMVGRRLPAVIQYQWVRSRRRSRRTGRPGYQRLLAWREHPRPP
jgi:PAS domain S-box-containing protein